MKKINQENTIREFSTGNKTTEQEVEKKREMEEREAAEEAEEEEAYTAEVAAQSPQIQELLKRADELTGDPVVPRVKAKNNGIKTTIQRKKRKKRKRSTSISRLTQQSSWKVALNNKRIEDIKRKRNIKNKYKSSPIVVDPSSGEWKTQKELAAKKTKDKKIIARRLRAEATKAAEEQAAEEKKRKAMGLEDEKPLYVKLAEQDEEQEEKTVPRNPLKLRKNYYEDRVKTLNHVDEFSAVYKKEMKRKREKERKKAIRERKRKEKEAKETKETKDLIKEIRAAQRDMREQERKAWRLSIKKTSRRIKSVPVEARRFANKEQEEKHQQYLDMKKKQQELVKKARSKIKTRKRTSLTGMTPRKIPDSKIVREKYVDFLTQSRLAREKARAKRIKRSKKRKKKERPKSETISIPEEEENLATLPISEVLSELSEDDEPSFIPTSRKRQNCIKEVLSTERDYVNHLRTINELYCKPITEQKLLPEHISSLLFDDLHVIRVVHEEFLDSLESYFANNFQELTEEEKAAHEAAGATKLMDIPKEMGYSLGQLFLETAPSFTKYTTYVNGYEKCVKAVTQQRNKYKKLYAFLDETSDKLLESGNRITTLESFLILPIQRIPRYRMLLELLVKTTDELHHDRENIERALELIKTLANYINDIKKQTQNQQRMAELSKILKMKNLVVAGRSFVHDGSLVSYKGKRRKDCTLYLFSDMLIYKFKKNLNVLPLYEHPKGSNSVLTPGGSLVERAHKIFSIEIPEATELDQYAFELVIPSMQVRQKFVCRSQYELKQWIDTFESSYEDVLTENAGLMLTLTLPEPNSLMDGNTDSDIESSSEVIASPIGSSPLVSPTEPIIVPSSPLIQSEI